jgi:ribose transport system permease protein
MSARLSAVLREHHATLSAYALCAVLFVVGVLHSSGFGSQSSIRQMLVFASFVGFAALGQTLVILAGGLDLSVPWLMAFGGVQLSHWASDGIPGGLAIVLVVAAGALIGAVNGLGVAKLRISPIVMTLAVGGLVQAYLLAVGLLKSEGNQVPQAAVDLASNRIGPVPVVALVWLVVAVATGFLLARTVVGRNIRAVGASDVVAHLSGVNVGRTRFITYVISGGASAFAGVVLSGYVGTTYLDIGAPYLFTSIAAVIVGGASILGGRGSYWGTVAGALTLTVLSAMLPLFHLSDAGLKVVYGVVILVGVWLSTSGGSALAALRARGDGAPQRSQEVRSHAG